MKYKIYAYVNGIVKRVYETEAKSHKDAALQLKDEMEYFHHFKIVGKSVKRFKLAEPKVVEVKGEIKAFKLDNKGHPSILLLIGTTPEFKHYANISERDKVYEEITCPTQYTVSSPAESVEKEEEQKDITVYSGETCVSKNGLTLTKTSNGFVVNATVKDLPTRLNTVKNSGKGKSKGTARNEWGTGSILSLSKPKQTLYAKVNVNYKDSHLFPTAVGKILEKNGNTIKVFKDAKMEVTQLYKDEEGFYYNEKWLDFEKLNLYLTKDIAENENMFSSSGSNMKAGKGLKSGWHEFSMCPCGCHLYQCDSTYVNPDYLSTIEEAPKVKNIFTAETREMEKIKEAYEMLQKNMEKFANLPITKEKS